MKRIKLLDEVELLLVAAKGACHGKRKSVAVAAYREAIRLANECRQQILRSGWFQTLFGLRGDAAAAMERLRTWIRLVISNARLSGGCAFGLN